MRVSQTRSRVAKRYAEKEAGDYSTERLPMDRRDEERNAMHSKLLALRQQMEQRGN